MIGLGKKGKKTVKGTKMSTSPIPQRIKVFLVFFNFSIRFLSQILSITRLRPLMCYITCQLENILKKKTKKSNAKNKKAQKNFNPLGTFLSVLRGHSVSSSPQQRPMTSDFEGFLSQILSITRLRPLMCLITCQLENIQKIYLLIRTPRSPQQSQ